MLIKSDLNCDIGCVRQNNEDIILLGGELFRDKAQLSDFEIDEEARFAAIVADGMGGHNGGEVASEFAAQFFSDFVFNLSPGLSPEELAIKIKNWTETVHRNLLDRGRRSPEYEGMGTTFCGLLFYGELVLALNIGDSRLYRFRNGILRQISTDHSMRELTGDQALPANQIYNSLGAGATAFVEIKELTGQLYNDDLFLVCSDGLCDMISDEEIEQILLQEPAAGKLVEAARAAGGKDNISVILLRLKEVEDSE
ncbi:MAG: protein phosphatase 2C domain-containing protein [Culturomica sp.]|jgi:protein phosphatase|nr:protein phosphatase 2C domain-containing protein [Culturomica sp.]